jgi:hypothetical protein
VTEDRVGKLIDVLADEIAARYQTVLQTEDRLVGLELTVVKVLEKRLAPLLRAGQASNEIVESTLAHVSHGGPTRVDAEKVTEAYRAALAALEGRDA